MRLKISMMVILLAAGLAAGCGTETADNGQAQTTTSGANTSADGTSDSDADTSAGGTSVSDSRAEEKTEVRREKYDDCDGSGHGYVEIYYSDGSMETEEY